MEKNPIITEFDYVIPDSPNGINLSYKTIDGNLYGIRSQIIEKADLHRIRVKGNIDLSKMNIKRKNEDCRSALNMKYGEFHGDVTLNEAIMDDLILDHGLFHKDLKMNLMMYADKYSMNEDINLYTNYIQANSITATDLYAC